MLKVLILMAAVGVGACSTIGDEEVDVSGTKANAGPRMIAVHSDYCSVCTSMKPIVNEIARRCDSEDVSIDVIDLTEDNEESIITSYKIVGLPTYIFVDENNVEVARLVGRQSESKLGQALSSLSGKDCLSLAQTVNVYEATEEKQTSCRSTNINATIASSDSRSLQAQTTTKKSNAQNVIESQGSCSQVSL